MCDRNVLRLVVRWVHR